MSDSGERRRSAAAASVRKQPLRIYRAEGAAALAIEDAVPALDGSLEAAQVFLDQVTRSRWWQRSCPPSWIGDDRPPPHGRFRTSRAPRRVIAQPLCGTRALVAVVDVSALVPRRNRWYPSMGLSQIALYGDRPAVADPWVILHELAHIMDINTESPTFHNREFARFDLMLVQRWLGPEAGAALRAAYISEGVKY